jgi:hypothetical protein
LTGRSPPGPGGGSCTIDLKKNGTSVLSGAVTLDSTTAAYALKDGTVTTPAYAAGDVFEVQVASPSGTKPKGVFARAVLREAAQ